MNTKPYTPTNCRTFIPTLKRMRRRAKRQGLKLKVSLNGNVATVRRLSELCPKYGSPGFYTFDGNGAYVYGAAEWQFFIG